MVSSCQRFATLRAHLDTAFRQPGQNLGQGLSYERLVALAAKGTLLSLRDVVQRCEKSTLTTSPSQVSWLTIPTCDRPRQLERALTSYEHNCTRFDRNVNVLVVDDSRGNETQEESKRVLQKFGGSGRYYLGRAERRSFVDSLVRDGDLPADLVQFGLLGLGFSGNSPGSVRNCILLRTVGDLLLSVDDDTVCQVATAAPCRRSNVCLRGHGECQEMWFFPDRGTALKSIEYHDIDIIAQHERLLGTRVPQIVAEHAQTPSGLDATEACPHMLASLWHGTGEVKVTYSGLVGDSAAYSHAGFIGISDQNSRTRLLRGEREYRQALLSREVARHAQSWTVSHGTAANTAVVGLDNRSLLPPFIPVYRNEDGVFAFTISHGLEQTYFGHVPYAVVHDPPRSSAQWRDWHPGAGRLAPRAVRVCDVVMGFIRMWPSPYKSRSAADRLISLGRHLVDLGSLHDTDFEEAVRHVVLMSASEQIRQLEALSHIHKCIPSYWAIDVQEYVVSLVEAMAAKGYVLPEELVKRHSENDVLSVLKHFIKRYGELLCWWPEIVATALRVRQRGEWGR